MAGKRLKSAKIRPLDNQRALTQDELRVAINRLGLRISNERCSQADYDLMEIELATLQARLSKPLQDAPVARVNYARPKERGLPDPNER